jgi:hypothetical protein
MFLTLFLSLESFTVGEEADNYDEKKNADEVFHLICMLNNMYNLTAQREHAIFLKDTNYCCFSGSSFKGNIPSSTQRSGYFLIDEAFQMKIIKKDPCNHENPDLLF